MTRPKNRDVPKNSSSPAAAAPCAGAPGFWQRPGAPRCEGAIFRLRRPGGGLRSWLAVRCTRTAAHRPPGTHSLRSRHSRAAASTPASLPSLTVPRGYASVGRLAGSGASPLSVHGLFRNGPLDAGLTPLPSCGCSALYRGPKAQRGVPRSGLWSEEWESPRSGVRYASGTGSERAKVASVAERNPPRALGPSVAGSLFRKSPDWGAP